MTARPLRHDVTMPMAGAPRLCVCVSDLATSESRQEAILRDVERATRARRWDVRFVGLRQSGSLAGEIRAYQPVVDPERYTQTRVTNTLLRIAERNAMLGALAPLALARTGDTLVEAILACDPDAVYLDVRWAAALSQLLVRDFPGPIILAGGDTREARVRSHVKSSASATSTQANTVSIVLPTHNGTRFLRQSIESCLGQSYGNIELIVVDDGSKEDIGSIVKEFTDPRLRFVRHERNRGLPAALNTGFRATTGAYLTWTSDDNYYAPDAIERMAHFLDRYPHIPFVYSSMYIVDEGAPGPLSVRRALPSSDLKRQNGVGASFMYTREVYREIGDYDRSATLVEDYDYWIRVSKRFRMQRLLDPLYYYRYHDQSLTAKHTADDVARRFDLVRQQNGVPMN
jgi:hypothetical protein